jgi:hypothetical protein
MNIDHIARVISEDINVNQGMRSIDVTTPPEEVRELLNAPLSGYLNDLAANYSADIEISSTGQYVRGEGPGDPMGVSPDVTVDAAGLIDANTGERMVQDSDYENIEIDIEPGDIIAQNPELLRGVAPEELVEIMRGAAPLSFSFGDSHSAGFTHADKYELETGVTWNADAEITKIGEFDGSTVSAWLNITNVTAEEG